VSGRQATDRAGPEAQGEGGDEMLAGEPPFTGPTPQAVIARRFTETPRPLSATRQRVPAHVEEAVGRALAKAPADRFQTPAEFAHELARGNATSLRAATADPAPLPAPSLFGRRPNLTTALAASLGLVVITAVAVLLWQRNQVVGPASVRRPSTIVEPPPATDPSRRPAADEPSLAVLPFTNLSPNPENEYFSDGMTEELISALGRVQGLRVAARGSPSPSRASRWMWSKSAGS
jgi:serine/threonine protein kinase